VRLGANAGACSQREPAKIAGYLGKGDQFDEAIADFAAAYADQAERDHKVLKKRCEKAG
jgi:hypothetical protein